MEDSVKKWMAEWVGLISQVKDEKSFNEVSDEWIEVDGIGRFKGLEVISEEYHDISEITITLKYDIWEKNI